MTATRLDPDPCRHRPDPVAGPGPDCVSGPRDLVWLRRASARRTVTTVETTGGRL